MPARARRPNAVLIASLLLVGWATLGAGSDSVAGLPADLGSAAELEQTLWGAPDRIPALCLGWASDLDGVGLDSPESETILAYAVEVAARRAARVFGQSEVADADVDLLLAMLQLDPSRFFADVEFRRRVASAWGPLVSHVPSADARLRLVERLAARGLDDFDALETVAVSWRVVPRSSSARRLDGASVVRTAADDELAPVEASIFSFPPFLDAAAAARLLVSVHATSPHRRLLVVADRELRERLRAMLERFRFGPETAASVTFLPSLGVEYSPWPRDPLTLARREDGGLHVVLRGNVQRGREADRNMGRVLVQGLPAALDVRWGRPSWHRAELPFHNGQFLDLGGASWVSVHSLEPRILELLGTDRLPVERFDADAGRRFVEAAHIAAAELSELRGRPVRFVHALPPRDAAGAHRAAQLGELAGGAGIDLDSVLTLLPRGDGSLAALVADVDLGTELVAGASDEDFRRLSIYGLSAGPGLLEAQGSAGARSLDVFLERVAEHLQAEGLEVHRLPILWIDPASTTRPDRAELSPFLINWNNVVLEERPLATGSVAAGSVRVAEGFASRLPAGDEQARHVFSRVGYELRLHAPLVESIVRNGGFRCSSQHVRRTGPGFLDTPQGAS